MSLLGLFISATLVSILALGASEEHKHLSKKIGDDTSFRYYSDEEADDIVDRDLAVVGIAFAYPIALLLWVILVIKSIETFM